MSQSSRKRLLLASLAVLGLASLSHGLSAGQCEREESGSSSAVRCKIRTLQDSSPDGWRSVLGATKLSLKCSELFFSSESHLSPEHFKASPASSSLEDLEVKHCQIRHLPARAFSGLTSLKSLAVRGHEDSDVGLELDGRSLRELPSLEKLDLSSNGLLSVPRNLLCDLKSLKSANLSSNKFLQLTDLSLNFVEGCEVPLLTLDVSNNLLGALRDGDLIQASGLTTLILAGNRITILSDNALLSLRSLEELDLSGNQLAALPPRLFEQSSSLRSLLLANNTLSLLPAGIFEGLANLVSLDLSGNAISSNLLSRETFSGLARLETLDLSWNQLTEIQASTFTHLPKLKELNLDFNSIHTVEPLSFSRQLLLEKLVLSNNELSGLTDDRIFEGLDESLTFLSLEHNELASLSESIFRQTSLVEELFLAGNKLSKVPASIGAGHLAKLKNLDLGENLIEELGAQDFAFLNTLFGLRLAGNRLSVIGKDLFSQTTSLHVLNLARNRIGRIEQGAFNSLGGLKALRLDNNLLTDINGVVSALESLEWFNVSSNRIIWFDYAFVPKSLEWLDLHDNQIEELGNYYKLKSGFSLKTLDASANRIKKLSKLSLPSSLETILLSDNAIASIEPKLFEDKPNLARVELASNEIRHLTLDSLFIGKFAVKGNYSTRPV